ncbi:hypothetical protein GBAR_LOCUS10725, partial [Geodia barretti]
MVDYILTESSLVGQVLSCLVHQHHPWELSSLTSPFVHATHQSIHELQWE